MLRINGGGRSCYQRNHDVTKESAGWLLNQYKLLQYLIFAPFVDLMTFTDRGSKHW